MNKLIFKSLSLCLHLGCLLGVEAMHIGTMTCSFRGALQKAIRPSDHSRQLDEDFTKWMVEYLSKDEQFMEYYSHVMSYGEDHPFKIETLENVANELFMYGFDPSNIIEKIQSFRPGVRLYNKSGPWIMRLKHFLLYGEEERWKFHVSATAKDALYVAQTAMPFLDEHKIAYKFIPSLGVMNFSDNYSMILFRKLFTLENKQECWTNDLSQVGKFITIYPQSQEEYEKLAKNLDELLYNMRQKNGLNPYVLTGDARVGKSGYLYTRFVLRGEDPDSENKNIPWPDLLNDPDTEYVPPFMNLAEISWRHYTWKTRPIKWSDEDLKGAHLVYVRPIGI
jgi:hypothetical protein